MRTFRLRRLALGTLASLALGCGARTEVGIGGGTASDASVGLDASADAVPAVPDVRDGQVIDVIVTDAGCSSDVQCDDAVGCTLDRCDPNLRVCTHLPRPQLCDDGIFCNGAEACNFVQGCVPGAAPSCSDGIGCTVDSCNEANEGCDHVPNDALCPISHTCDLQLGCQARAIAHSGTTLYDIRLPSGQVKVIGPTGSQLTDIALHPSNVLYGIGFNQLYTVNQSTGVATFFKSTTAGNINGADVSPTGSLYVSGGSGLYTLDLGTGVATFVTSFPPGRSSSGDLAFVGPRLLASATGSQPDDLVEFDLVTKTSKILGSIGFTCVWGLAAYGPTLYGLTCNGAVLSIDTTTGKGTQLNGANVAFWGASAR